VDASDFVFYERIAVPPPTFCPDCRLQRRLVWRNERSLFKRKCDLCGENNFSVYPPEASYKVYCFKCWYSDRWDPLEYGISLDFSKSFLEQYRELLTKAPRIGLFRQIACENVDYANYVDESKSVFLAYSVIKNSENVFYSKNIDHSEWIFDCFDVSNSQHCFQNIGADKNYQCSYAYFSRNCIDCSFIYDCVNCNNCFMSTGLRSREFYFKNKPCSKEEYLKLISAFNFGDSRDVEALKNEFKGFYFGSIHKYARVVNVGNSSGDDLRDCKNTQNSFSTYNTENVKFLFRTLNIKDSVDATNAGWCELMYEFIGGGAQQSQRVRFCSYASRNLIDVHYVDLCNNCSYLFGCIGLKNKEYCILNKVYEKEEYKKLIPKLVDHMNEKPYLDKNGMVYKYGEFFPTEFSPFAYNETVAQEYFPLTKESAKSSGFKWKDFGVKSHNAAKEEDTLPKDIKEVDNGILKEIIACAHSGSCAHQCTGAFRILPQELEFYRRRKIALPNLCPNCRHYERLSWRNPLKLWHRQCMCDRPSHSHSDRCPVEFETPYSPERKETVYCESCYNSEVI
jgi:hypothetical protein